MDCSICGNPIETTWFGWADGNNAHPINGGRCCDDCDMKVVMPARLVSMWLIRAQDAEEIGQSLSALRSRRDILLFTRLVSTQYLSSVGAYEEIGQSLSALRSLGIIPEKAEDA